jgi:hypothetical protein
MTALTVNTSQPCWDKMEDVSVSILSLTRNN